MEENELVVNEKVLQCTESRPSMAHCSHGKCHCHQSLADGHICCHRVQS